MGQLTIVRFDDLGLGASNVDWGPWIDFIIANKITPVVCIVPNNIDSAVGCAGIDEYMYILERLKNIGSIFLAHGFNHSLLNKGNPVFNIYDKGELLNLDEHQFSSYSNLLMDAEKKLGLKFLGYAPPAHMFDLSFLRFVEFNSKNITPVVNDLFGDRLYFVNKVCFIPLMSNFTVNNDLIKTFSIHPAIDRIDGKIFKKLKKSALFFNPREIYHAIEHIKYYKSRPSFAWYNLYTIKSKRAVKMLLNKFSLLFK